MKALRKAFLLGTALPVFAALSACSGGGGGGGLASTPTPTPASYTKIVDMTGDRTFQTGGVQYNTNASGFSNASTQAFGSGVTVAYTVANDSYRLTASDGSTVTFDPSNAQTPPPGSNAQVWVKTTGTTRDQFFLSVPSVSGVPLSYTLTGSWGRFDTTNGTGLVRLAVGGAPTIASDMPKSGTATYATAIGGSAVAAGAAPAYTLTGSSTATFSANFGTGAITTAMTLGGTQASTGATVTNFGTFNGTGAITSAGPGFTGSLTGTGATGVFSGAFFGPQALEMGYQWSINGGPFTAVGTVTGRKN